MMFPAGVVGRTAVQKSVGRVTGTVEEFAQAYRAQRNPSATDAEVQEQFELFKGYAKGFDTVETAQGPMTRTQIKERLAGLQDETEIDRVVDEILDRQITETPQTFRKNKPVQTIRKPGRAPVGTLKEFQEAYLKRYPDTDAIEAEKQYKNFKTYAEEHDVVVTTYGYLNRGQVLKLLSGIKHTRSQVNELFHLVLGQQEKLRVDRMDATTDVLFGGKNNRTEKKSVPSIQTEIGQELLRGLDQKNILESENKRIRDDELLVSAIKRVTKVVMMKKTIDYSRLPATIRTEFARGLNTADLDVGKVLRKIYHSTAYRIGDEHRSYYSEGLAGDVVVVGKRATASTLAHELFHKIDKDRRINTKLFDSLMKDYISLTVQSESEDIKSYLVVQYPSAFEKNLAGAYVLKVEYRGIADILNGLSGGTVQYGYGHKRSYWMQDGKVEAEAWSQFGRVFYENNSYVVKMMEEIFPSFTKQAKEELRGVLQSVERNDYT